MVVRCVINSRNLTGEMPGENSAFRPHIVIRKNARKTFEKNNLIRKLSILIRERNNCYAFCHNDYCNGGHDESGRYKK